MKLFEKAQTEASETDKIMNRLSRGTVIKSSNNPRETEFKLSSLDLEGFQFYIEMIDSQKRKIKLMQHKLRVFNSIVVSIFIMTCLCDVCNVFGTHETFYA